MQHLSLRKLNPAKTIGPALLAAICAAPQFAFASCGNTTTKMREILGTSYTTDTLVLAHRGLWGKYAGIPSLPENSRGSLSQADLKCMDGVELDVKVTKDGVPILMHDFNLGRTTNVYAVMGGSKYNPMTNQGRNPAVSTVAWNTVQQLELLTPDRSVATGYHPPRLDQLFDYWKSQGMTVPMVFDTKTADAVRAVHTIALQKFGRPDDVVAVKVNATLFPTPSAFIGNAKYITAIPVFTTNMLSKIDVSSSRAAWQGYVNTLEINVKQDGGLLQGQMDTARRAGKRVGVFHAIPDGPVSGQFYQNTGQCCYRLSDLFFSYSGGKDTADHRGDQGYLLYQGFGLITTDDPVGVNRFLGDHGKRVSHIH
ncbi:Glycerophosphoryl diester phosphodiesterase family protein [Variovorax sp. YR266]|uniref:glycerophosphodiester phosphodiesterase family protein n=1 Tax=Variovorax sp. YR266 TaxID=1884386 RepID=UPI0008956CDA|nr:glycerophosphodiester phosphodiesterase family protein [Variovorax sp. YR266]SDZ70416.1 Glycerophosphoryl diester phosphodiesterase family protein [Variovorax sp. YR266]